MWNIQRVSNAISKKKIRTITLTPMPYKMLLTMFSNWGLFDLAENVSKKK
jgi:hypothetical protein